MNELEKLIKEQIRDMRYGAYQKPEPLTIHYGACGNNSDSNIFDVMEVSKLRDYALYTAECAYHGRSMMHLDYNGSFRCRLCERSQSEAYRRKNGRKPMARCPHDETITRKRDCKECVSEWNKAGRKNWYKTEKGQAYLKRKWAASAAKRTPEMRHAEYLRRKARQEAQARSEGGAA